MYGLHACVYVCVHMCGGPRLASEAFHDHSASLSLKQSLSVEITDTGLSRAHWFWGPHLSSESQVGPHTHQLLSGVWGSKLWSHASWQVLYPLHPLFSPHKACYFLTPFFLFFNWIQFRVLGQCLLSPTPVLEYLLHMIDKETPSNPRPDSHAAANCLHLPLVIPKPLLRTVTAHCGLNIILSTWPLAINV